MAVIQWSDNLCVIVQEINTQRQRFIKPSTILMMPCGVGQQLFIDISIVMICTTALPSEKPVRSGNPDFNHGGIVLK